MHDLNHCKMLWQPEWEVILSSHLIGLVHRGDLPLLQATASEDLPKASLAKLCAHLVLWHAWEAYLHSTI